MIRSMYAAVSGLRSHQEMINVTGNNIANVNTAGFKKSSTLFQDVLGQTLAGGSQPSPTLGGTNPSQVGLGVRVAGVSQNMTQGPINRTGRVLDMAIEGDGFFMLDQGGQSLLTRAGSFFLDGQGRLVGAQGGFVQGWQADTAGQIDPTAPPGIVRIPLGDQAQPQPTTSVTVGGNLPSATTSPVNAGFNAYDAQGNPTPVELTFTPAGPNTWTLAGTHAGSPLSFSNPTITFGADGEMTSATPITATTAGGQAFDLVLGGSDQARRVTQFAGSGGMAVVTQDGAPSGTLQSLAVGQDGIIFGSYSNGRSKPLGQLALASFANPEGLERVAGTNFRASANSGLAQVGTLGSGGRGLLLTSTLEGSNVDLAEEFTELIRGQRGFQANSRVITTSDEVLQEVVNLKR